MNINTFSNRFSDVRRQKLEAAENLSRAAAEKLAIELCQGLRTGLVQYYAYGNEVEVYSSREMLELQHKLTKGAEVTNEYGQIFIIESDHVFICGGEPCIRARYSTEDACDTYNCAYFQPSNK